MKAFLNRLTCGMKGHHFLHWRNIYGDEIIASGWKRSIWKCANCGKIERREDLK